MNKPLEGLRVLVLRPEGQSEDLADLLRSRGAHPVEVPAVRIVPLENPSELDAALKGIGAFDWLVFTSVNGVGAFLERLGAAGRSPADLTTPIAAIGPATRARLEGAGLTVHWMPGAYTTKALAAELPKQSPLTALSDDSPRLSVCLFRADRASPELEETLRTRGFRVERVDVYGTESINARSIREALRSVDAVVLTSASIARSFAAASKGALPDGLRIFSIGPATSEACLACGLHPAGEAAEHTVEGIVEAIAAQGYP